MRLKLLKKRKKNAKNICDTFHHSFKNIPCFVTSEVSLKRFYFALFDNGLTLKTLKLAYIGFCIQTLQMKSGIYCIWDALLKNIEVLKKKAHTFICLVLHSKNYGVKITSRAPVLIEDSTMHLTPVLNLRCYFNTQCCYSNTFGCYFNTIWCYVQTLGCNFNTSRVWSSIKTDWCYFNTLVFTV